jgi:hypothetical protein
VGRGIKLATKVSHIFKDGEKPFIMVDLKIPKRAGKGKETQIERR